MLEVLVTVAIVVLVAVITFPVLVSSKQQSRETVTKRNLRQCWLALELYRVDHDGSERMVGSSSTLGLPNREGFFEVYGKSGLKAVWWRDLQKKGYGPIYYPFDESDIHSDNPDQHALWFKQWLDYNSRHEGKSVVVGDFNHTRGCGEFPDERCLFKGFGVRLDGGLDRKEAAGIIFLIRWWDQ